MKDKANEIKPIICLNRDRSTSFIDSYDLKRSIKSDEVKYYLFPTGVEEKQYLVFKPKQILYKIDSVDISLVLSATSIRDGISSVACGGHPKNIHCKNVLEFYNAMHSFSKMSAFNIISNCKSDSDFADKSFFTISAFEMTVKFTNGKKDKFRMKDKDKYRVIRFNNDSAPMLDALLMAIDDFFEIGDNYHKDRLIPSEIMPTFYIDVGTSTWFDEDDIKKRNKKQTKVVSYKKMDPFEHNYGYIKSFNLNINGTIAFIPPEDYALLKKYCCDYSMDRGRFILTTYCEMTHPDTWTYEDRINSEDIYTDVNNFYCHNQVEYKLLTYSDILEALHMMIYMIQSYKTMESILNITDDVRQYMVEILLVIKNVKDSVGLAQFRFNITDREIDDRSEGLYNDFFNELRAFIETNCN